MAVSSAMLRRWTPSPCPTTSLNVGGEHETGHGVFLTWRDVSVTAVDENGRHKQILDRITGCARPGQVLALMGASGSGKTTLLDTLSGNAETIFRLFRSLCNQDLGYEVSLYFLEVENLEQVRSSVFLFPIELMQM
jgi:ABC-type glutathione transport system ATPase component